MGDEELAMTRRSLHAVAELVLAGPQYRATGKLRLRVVPGGFATVLAPELRAIGTGVVGAGGVAVPIDGHTARAIGAELGVTAGRPEGAYADGAGVDPDETLTLHPGQADVIMGALSRGHDALIAFAPAETPVLWPEHFDVAIRVRRRQLRRVAGRRLHRGAVRVRGRLPPAGRRRVLERPVRRRRAAAELPDAAAVTAFFAEGRSRRR